MVWVCSSSVPLGEILLWKNTTMHILTAWNQLESKTWCLTDLLYSLICLSVVWQEGLLFSTLFENSLCLFIKRKLTLEKISCDVGLVAGQHISCTNWGYSAIYCITDRSKWKLTDSPVSTSQDKMPKQDFRKPIACWPIVYHWSFKHHG